MSTFYLETKFWPPKSKENWVQQLTEEWEWTIIGKNQSYNIYPKYHKIYPYALAHQNKFSLLILIQKSTLYSFLNLRDVNQLFSVDEETKVIIYIPSTTKSTLMLWLTKISLAYLFWSKKVHFTVFSIYVNQLFSVDEEHYFLKIIWLCLIKYAILI